MSVVAVLGTGRMGSAMARALARAGHQLILYNRTEAKARSLAETLGAAVAVEPGSAVGDADLALTMLADGPAVEETYRRAGGVLEGVRDGSILLEMSTVEPHVSMALEPEVRARGGALLDSPVSGSVALAEQGQLTLMMGGDAAVLERARPVLDALAGRVFHLGPVGTGAAMKLAVNAVVFGLNGAVAEGLVLAEFAGVDRALAYDVIAASAAGAPFVAYKRDAFVDPEGTPTAFALELAEKDLRLIAVQARSLGISLPQSVTNLEVIRQASADGRADRDFSSVAEYLREAGRIRSDGGASE